MGWKEPHKFSLPEMAFPARVIEHMPSWEEIPQEYKRWWTHPTAVLAQKWFSNELVHSEPMPDFYPQQGVDADDAFRHIHTVLSSFQPKHEHKIAACAMLIELYFVKIVKGDAVLFDAGADASNAGTQ